MKPELRVVGIDLAKSIFHLAGMDERGKIIFRKRLARGEVLPFMAQLPRVLVGMEACGGAHYWARHLREQGHEVKLMAPQYVKPYVKTNKNDLRDAEDIAEAVTRHSMRFVPIKNVEQQDLQAFHRVRERLMGRAPPSPTKCVGSWPSMASYCPPVSTPFATHWRRSSKQNKPS